MYILWRIETSPNRRYLFGGLSLIIWTITLLSLIKYMVFVLSADDNGEGGIFALYALLCRHMLSSKDINFVGYTYKNVEIVNDALPRIAEAKKKSNKPKRPSVKSLFEDDESTPQGSFLNLLPAKFEETEKAVGSSSKSSSSG